MVSSCLEAKNGRNPSYSFEAWKKITKPPTKPQSFTDLFCKAVFPLRDINLPFDPTGNLIAVETSAGIQSVR